MLRHLLRLLALPVLALALCAPVAQAQQAATTKPAAQPQPAASDEEKSEGPSSGPAYVVLALYTMLVLTIACMPSRKA